MRKSDITADWRGDYKMAALMRSTGEFAATLRLERWHLPGDRTPHVAWVVAWVDPTAESPALLTAVVEVPAKEAGTPARRGWLLRAARESMARGPKDPARRAGPLPSLPTADERFRQTELLIDAWDTANSALRSAADADGPSAAFERYLALSDLLNRTYAVDRTLQGLWDSLPDGLREKASTEADQKANRAIERNRRVLGELGRTYVPEADASLETYFERKTRGRPYPHWTGPLMSGSLQVGFFGALKWIRGQMTYRGVIEPIELWQHRDGAEPRWKWKDAAAISKESSNRRQRAEYRRFLAGQDVLGLFSHLLDVFWDAKWQLRKLLVQTERDQVTP